MHGMTPILFWHGLAWWWLHFQIGRAYLLVLKISIHKSWLFLQEIVEWFSIRVVFNCLLHNLNSGLSFSLKDREPNLPCYFTHTLPRKILIHAFLFFFLITITFSMQPYLISTWTKFLTIIIIIIIIIVTSFSMHFIIKSSAVRVLISIVELEITPNLMSAILLWMLVLFLMRKSSGLIIIKGKKCLYW